MKRLLVSLLLLAGANVARAETDDERTVTDRARSHLKSGFAYYAEANYESASREMEAAYKLRPLPELQYNLAQCYERLGRTRDAIGAYRIYLDGKPKADDHDEVAVRIKNLELRADKEAAGAPPPQIVEKEKVVLKEVVVYREAPPKPGRGLRIAAFAVGALAVVALSAGITFTVLAGRDADAVGKGGNQLVPVPFDGTQSQTQAAGQQDVVLAWVSYGVAAVAAAGAVGLYLIGNKIDRDTAKLTLAPSIGPQGGGLAVAGSF